MSQFNRDDLAKLKGISKRTISAFENLDFGQDDLIQSVAAIRGASIIGVGFSDAFTTDRALVGSADILLTDGGPKGNLTIGLTPSGVSAATYGGPAYFVSFAVNARGRITLAAQYAASTTNVSEGGNLYFTNTRARNALVGGTGISYTAGTGTIAVDTLLAGLSGMSTGLGLVEQTGAVTFAKRAIGAASSTDILSRAAADGRYILAGGALYLKARSASATFTPAADDYFVRLDATGGAITINLPAGASSNGRIFVFKKIDGSANAITIDPNGSELIDFAATYAFSTTLQSVTIQCDGANWWII